MECLLYNVILPLPNQRNVKQLSEIYRSFYNTNENEKQNNVVILRVNLSTISILLGRCFLLFCFRYLVEMQPIATWSIIAVFLLLLLLFWWMYNICRHSEQPKEQMHSLTLNIFILHNVCCMRIFCLLLLHLYTTILHIFICLVVSNQHPGRA